MPVTNTLLLMFFPSILVQTAILVYARANNRVRGAGALAFLMVTTLVWTIGAFAEVAGGTYQWKLAWRNVTQIGVTFLPVALLSFSLLYSGVSERTRRRLTLSVLIFAFLTLALILTDELHHLMRAEVSLIQSGELATIRVVPTLLSGILLSYVPMCGAASLAILVAAIPSAPPIVKRQLALAAAGLAIPIGYAIIKSYFNRGVLLFVPTPIAFIPMGVALVIAIFRYRMAAISPIARNRVFDVIHEAIVVCDHEGNLIDANRSARALLAGDKPSPPPSARRGRSGGAVPTAADVRSWSSEWADRIAARDESCFTVRRDERGELRSYQICQFGLTDRAGRFVGSISVIRDVTSEVEYEHYLRAQAELDLMTGVLNRATFIERSRARIAERSNSGLATALLVLDLDRFKAINDLLGHQEGDRVVVQFASALRSAVKETDIVGRIGGDEFAILLSVDDRKVVDRIAERTRSSVEKTIADPTTGTRMQCTTSIGCSIADAEEATGPAAYAALFARADEALYRAKDSGRNAVSW